MKNEVVLGMSKVEFVSLYTLLINTTLGNSNMFESAISDLLIDLEKVEANTLVRGWLLDALGSAELPKIGVKYSPYNDVEINIQR